MATLADFRARTITGEDRALADYAGNVVLVVNTASKCGLTPQFAGLEQLYDDLKDQGLVILGFPCAQFAHQEFDSDTETAEFCQLNYGVSFPMFAKIDVNGDDAHPLYSWLRTERDGTQGNDIQGNDIQWNFTKFLLDRRGEVTARYEPAVAPAELEADIRALL